MYPHNESLRKNSQILRKNMTPEEKHLWYDFLKFLPVTVKRQCIVGNFILDFFIPSFNLAIELDGSQHFEPEAKKYDTMRDKELSKMGIHVVRYTNSDINRNFDGVINNILMHTGFSASDLRFK